MTKQVPLRNGIGGPVIGTATIRDDGVIEAKITDPDFEGLITTDLSMYSLAPNDINIPSHDTKEF